MYKLGLDIGGTKIHIGILDPENTLLGIKKLYVSKLTDPIGEIRSQAWALARELSVPKEEIGFCGVGVPGTVSDDGKHLLKAPNISLLSESFAKELEDALSIPVKMIQDSRAAAWGEYLCGAGKDAKTLICITLGTGIGTGIVLNGKIYNGALGAAGELGHVPVSGGDRPCGCGKIGCMEKYAAGRGLDITASELLGEGKTAKDLFAAAKGGDQKAKDAIENAVSLLGTTLVAAVNLLSPDCLLFSGGMSEEGYYLDAVIDFIRAHCYFSGAYPRLARAALGEYAPLYGAALSKR